MNPARTTRPRSVTVLVALLLSAELLFAEQAAPPDQRANPAVPPTAAAMPIDAVLQEAMERNLDLLAERYNLSVSDARMITARLRPNPVLSLGSIYLPLPGTNFQPSLSGVGPTEYNSRVDFLFERGGKRDSRMALAKADREYAELALKNTLRSLIFSVQSAFVDVQIAKENLQLASDNRRAFQAIVDINTARVAAGDLAKVELSRIRIAALQFQNAVQQAQLQLRQAQSRLQLLMGRRTPDAAFDVVGDLRRETLTQDLGQLSVLARQRRPDLRSLEAAQARSQADMRLQIAQGKIDYTIGAQYSHQRVTPGTASSVSVFVSAPLPVFNRNQGEVARADRESQQSAARLQALTSSIDTEVRSAFEQYRTNKDLLDNIEANMLNQAGEVRRTTEYSYRRGEASLVEFLDAQRAFNDTMQSYNQARADYARSLYLIDSITGRLEGSSK